MRTPYIGEIMHFYEFPKGTHPGPRAAIVAYVWKDDESVNLTVLDPHGSVGAATGIEVLQPGEKYPEKVSYCEFILDEDKQPDKVPEKTGANINPNTAASSPAALTPNAAAPVTPAKPVTPAPK